MSEDKHIYFDHDELFFLGGRDCKGVWRDFNREDIKAGKADEFMKDRARRIAAEKAAKSKS